MFKIFQVRILVQAAIAIMLMATLQSCSVQNLFQSAAKETDNEALLMQGMAGKYEHRLRPDDKVSVSVWEHEEYSIGSIFGIYNSNEVYGKWELVDLNGEINMPKLGKVKIGGLTLAEAADTIAGRLSYYVVDPMVVVKVLNLEVTVMGEVNEPGSYLLEKERNSLVEVLGRSGGFDFYADKTKIKLIRGGYANPKEYLLDLTKMDEYQINNIILQADDVVYVPAKNAKATDKRASTLIPVATVLSAAAILLTIIL